MEALFISADSDDREINTSRYRILTPAKYLQQAGHTITLQKNEGWEHQVSGKLISIDRGIDYSNVPDVVLIERNIKPEWIEKIRLAGAKRVIATFDDHYGIMPPSTVAKPWWDKYYKDFLKSLGLVDIVVVPSRALVDAYKPYCKDIRYVPNFIDDDLWIDPPKVEERKVIGWGGSVEHIESWNQMELGKSLDQVLKDHPDWELYLCCGAGPIIGRYFPKGMKYSWSDWMPNTEWFKRMSTFKIGLAPLNGAYDRYRSNLKLVEYGMGSVPWVASAMDPYTRHDVLGGLLVAGKNWYRLLSELVESEDVRLALATVGHGWAEGYRMSRNVPVYESFLWDKVKN